MKIFISVLMIQALLVPNRHVHPENIYQYKTDKLLGDSDKVKTYIDNKLFLGRRFVS